MHPTVNKVRSLLIYGFGIGLDDVSGNVAGNFEQSVIVLDSVVEVNRRILIFVFILKVALFKLNDSLHQRVPEMKSQLGIVCIIIWHSYQ